MPSPKYTNKDLRSEHGNLGVVIEPPKGANPDLDGGSPTEPTIDEILQKAHQSIGNSDAFLRSIGEVGPSSGMSEPLDPSIPPGLEFSETRPGMLSRTPELLKRLALAGSMVPIPQVALPSDMYLAGSGLYDVATGGMKRVKEHPFQTAADVGFGLVGARGLSKGYEGLKAAQAAQAAQRGNPEMVREVVDTARGYQAEGATAAQAGARAGWPLGKSKATLLHTGMGYTENDPVTEALDRLHAMRKAGSPVQPKPLDPWFEQPRSPTEILSHTAPTQNPLLDQLDTAMMESHAADRHALMGRPENVPANPMAQAVEQHRTGNLPGSWQAFAENPVTQDLRSVLEDLRKRPTGR